MAYTQRYHAEWDDLYGVHRGVEIYEKDYGGSSESLQVYGASPGRRRMRGIRGDEDKLINGTEFEFTFYTSNSNKSDFDDLFESNYKDHYLIAYKNYGETSQQIKFRGWLKPENMKRVFLDATYAITISATDALADLKDIEFLQSDGSFYEGTMPALEAIKEALNKINPDSNTPFALDFRIVSNIHETSLMDTDTSGNPTDNALRVTNIDTRRFLKDDGGRVQAVNCNEVIEKVLFDFNCKLRQKDDQYWLIDNDESAYAGDNQIIHYVHEVSWNDLTTSTRSEITNYENITDDDFQRGGDFSKLKPLKGLDVIFKNKYQGSDIDDDAATGDPLLGDWNDWTVNGAVSSNVDSNGVLSLTCATDDYSCFIESPTFNLTSEADNEFIKLLFQHIWEITGDGSPNFFIQVNKPWQSDDTFFKTDETMFFRSTWQEYISPNSETFRVFHNSDDSPYVIRIKIAFTPISTGGQATIKFKPPTVRKVVPTGAVSGDAVDVLSFVTRDISHIGQQAGGLGIPETETWFGDSENQYDIGRLVIGGTLTSLWDRFNRSDSSPIIDLKIQSRLNNRKKYASIVKFPYVDTEDIIDVEKVLKVGSNSFGVEEGWYEIIGLDKEYFKGVAKITARQLFTQDVTLSFTSSQLRSADGTSTTSPYDETGGSDGGGGSGGGSNPMFFENKWYQDDDFFFNTINDQTFNFNNVNQDRSLFNIYENDFGDTENLLASIDYDYTNDWFEVVNTDFSLGGNNLTEINKLFGVGSNPIDFESNIDLLQNDLLNINNFGGGGNDIGVDDNLDLGQNDLKDIGSLDFGGGNPVNGILPTMPDPADDTKLLTAGAIKTYVDNQVGGASELGELDDVSLTSEASGELIQYNGTNWVNVSYGLEDARGEGDTFQGLVNWSLGSDTTKAIGITGGTESLDIYPFGIEMSRTASHIRPINNDTQTLNIGSNASSKRWSVIDLEAIDVNIPAGAFSLASGTSVNEIVTSIDGASTDDQLPTAAAVNDRVTGWGLEDARGAGDTLAGDIDMAHNAILNPDFYAIYSVRNNTFFNFSTDGSIDFNVDIGGGSSIEAMEFTSNADVKFAENRKIYKANHQNFTQIGTSGLYYKILPDGTVMLFGDGTTSSSGSTALLNENLPGAIIPNQQWEVPVRGDKGGAIFIQLQTNGELVANAENADGNTFNASESVSLDGIIYDPNHS